MSTAQSVEHIEATSGVIGGKPRIKGTRVGVHDVKTWHLDQGVSVEDICRDYGLQPAEVHAALAYYYDHREEVDRRQAEAEALVEELRRSQPSILEKYGRKDASA